MQTLPQGRFNRDRLTPNANIERRSGSQPTEPFGPAQAPALILVSGPESLARTMSSHIVTHIVLTAAVPLIDSSANL
jgi:hypothetical protein